MLFLQQIRTLHLLCYISHLLTLQLLIVGMICASLWAAAWAQLWIYRARGTWVKANCCHYIWQDSNWDHCMYIWLRGSTQCVIVFLRQVSWNIFNSDSMATHLLSYSVYESLFLWHLKHHSIISFPPLHVWVFFFSTSWLVYAEEVSTRFGLRCPSLHYASWVSHSFVLFWRTERALCALIHWFEFKLSLKNEELKMRCEPAEMLVVLTSVCRHNTDIMNISGSVNSKWQFAQFSQFHMVSFTLHFIRETTEEYTPSHCHCSSLFTTYSLICFDIFYL